MNSSPTSGPRRFTQARGRRPVVPVPAPGDRLGVVPKEPEIHPPMRYRTPRVDPRQPPVARPRRGDAKRGRSWLSAACVRSKGDYRSAIFRGTPDVIERHGTMERSLVVVAISTKRWSSDLLLQQGWGCRPSRTRWDAHLTAERSPFWAEGEDYEIPCWRR